MADGHATMQGWIDQLRALPAALTRDAAPAVAGELEREIRANIARGVGPDGKSWQPTEDGAKPLPNAGRDLTVRALGSRVVATVEGVHARHHFGWKHARGGVKRQILPTNDLPEPFARAIEKVIADRFARATGGAR